VLSLPSPTLRPREQADLARYRSFVRITVGSVFDGHGLGDRLSRDGCVDVSLVGRLLICGFGKIVCESFRLKLSFSSDA